MSEQELKGQLASLAADAAKAGVSQEDIERVTKQYHYGERDADAAALRAVLGDLIRDIARQPQGRKG